MTFLLENVTVDELLSWMKEPVDFEEGEYQEWKAERIAREAPKRNPFENLLERPQRKPRTYVSGSDFRSYLSCARILFWNVHDPLPRRVYHNKGTFEAIVRHEVIQERLEARGWHGEYEPRRWLPFYEIQGLGHMDALSPSETYFLEIKHNRPVAADELQASWYQYIHIKSPEIVLLYRDQVKVLPDLGSFVAKYLPRVIGVVQHPEALPPRHPNFPLCRGTCDYGPRCGRDRKVRMHQGTPPEWIEFFKKIGAWRG